MDSRKEYAICELARGGSKFRNGVLTCTKDPLAAPLGHTACECLMPRQETFGNCTGYRIRDGGGPVVRMDSRNPGYMASKDRGIPKW